MMPPRPPCWGGTSQNGEAGVSSSSVPLEPVPLSPRPRGRPKGSGARDTLVVNVRIPIAVYDAYCRYAIRSSQPVRTVIREFLTKCTRRRGPRARPGIPGDIQ
jgi:hypothetical protein